MILGDYVCTPPRAKADCPRLVSLTRGEGSILELTPSSLLFWKNNDPGQVADCNYEGVAEEPAACIAGAPAARIPKMRRLQPRNSRGYVDDGISGNFEGLPGDQITAAPGRPSASHGQHLPALKRRGGQFFLRCAQSIGVLPLAKPRVPTRRAPYHTPRAPGRRAQRQTARQPLDA